MTRNTTPQPEASIVSVETFIQALIDHPQHRLHTPAPLRLIERGRQSREGQAGHLAEFHATRGLALIGQEQPRPLPREAPPEDLSRRGEFLPAGHEQERPAKVEMHRREPQRELRVWHPLGDIGDQALVIARQYGRPQGERFASCHAPQRRATSYSKGPKRALGHARGELARQRRWHDVERPRRLALATKLKLAVMPRRRCFCHRPGAAGRSTSPSAHREQALIPRDTTARFPSQLEGFLPAGVFGESPEHLAADERLWSTPTEQLRDD